MSVVWDKEYLVRLTEEGLPGAPVTTAASEATRSWRGNEVLLEFANGSQRGAMVRPDGTAVIVNPVLDSTPSALRVRRLGPHAMPCEWITTVKDLAKLTPGGTLDVSIRARLRHSAWLALSSLFTTASPAVSGTAPTVDVATDLLDALSGHLDDLSALETVTVGDPSSSDPRKQVAWHGGYVSTFQPLPNASAPRAKADPDYRDRGCVAFSKAVIAAAHARGLQVLAGYEIVGTGTTNTVEGERFKSWIHGATPAQVRAHADAIYQFLWIDRGLDFDGLGFDLEIAGLAPPVENMRVLIHRMAELMAPDNRIVTYATVPFTEDGKTGKEASHLRTQPFWLARDMPNIIARPMGYDGGESYHPASIACALGDVKLHPSQFQMGIKLIQRPQPGISGHLSDAEVAKRCTEMYAPNRVGLIGFALQRGQNLNVPVATKAIGVQSYFPHLNPGITRTATAGQPLQCPLRTTVT
jgi:hypothetical protein